MKKIDDRHYAVESDSAGTQRFAVIRPAHPYPPVMGPTKAQFWVDIPSAHVCAVITAETMREVAQMLLTAADHMDDMEAQQ